MVEDHSQKISSLESFFLMTSISTYKTENCSALAYMKTPSCWRPKSQTWWGTAEYSQSQSTRILGEWTPYLVLLQITHWGLQKGDSSIPPQRLRENTVARWLSPSQGRGHNQSCCISTAIRSWISSSGKRTEEGRWNTMMITFVSLRTTIRRC